MSVNCKDISIFQIELNTSSLRSTDHTPLPPPSLSTLMLSQNMLISRRLCFRPRAKYNHIYHVYSLPPCEVIVYLKCKQLLIFCFTHSISIDREPDRPLGLLISPRVVLLHFTLVDADHDRCLLVS